jgi:RNA polymerase sigma factor (sigma-70 family)
VVRNHVRKQARRNKRFESLDALCEGSAPGARSPWNPAFDVSAEELRGVIVAVTAGFPSRRREIAELSWQRQMEIGEIANRLGISVGSVKSELCRARQILWAKLHGGDGLEH